MNTFFTFCASITIWDRTAWFCSVLLGSPRFRLVRLGSPLGSPLGSARFRLVPLGSPLGSARFCSVPPRFSSFFWSWFAFLPSDSARLAPAQAEPPKSNANSSLKPPPHPRPSRATQIKWIPSSPKSNGNSLSALPPLRPLKEGL